MKSAVLDVLFDERNEAFIQIPDDMMPEGWEIGTVIEWVDNKDGTWTLRKKDMDFVEAVQEFNEVAGTGGSFDARKVALYIGLQLEELGEKIEALPNVEDLVSLKQVLEHYSTCFKTGQFDTEVEQINRVEALDADVDLAVVALGGACALGADVKGACTEVMSSNLSKFPVGPDGKRYALKDENGKVKKAEGYRPPSLERFV